MPPSGLTSAEVTQIYSRYGFLLLRRARLITRDVALAEDAVHEALIQLLSSGAGFREATHPLRWLQVVVDRKSIDQLRRGKHVRGAATLDDPELQALAHPGVDVEARDAALKFLGELDATDQRIVVAAYVDGMSQEQIALEVGFSRVTVNKRLQAIKRDALPSSAVGALARGEQP